MRKIRETASRITCVACQRNAEAHSDKLCQACAVDPEMLQIHCSDTVIGYRVETDRLFNQVEAALPGKDDPLLERWGAYQYAYAKQEPAAAKVEAMARAGRADPLLDLIRLWLAYTDAKAVYQERERWAEQVYQAIGELDTLRSV